MKKKKWKNLIFTTISPLSPLFHLRYSPRPPYGFICIKGVLYYGKSTTEHRNEMFEPLLGHFLRATEDTEDAEDTEKAEDRLLA